MVENKLDVLELLNLPLWVKVLGAGVVGLVSFTPKFVEFWNATLPSRHFEKRQRHQLETLKLWLEVRALAASAGIPLPDIEAPAVLQQLLSPAKKVTPAR